MRYAILALAALGILATPVAAHPDGHDKDNRPQRRLVSEMAQDAVVKLVTQAKLPASWSKAKLVKSDIRTRNGAQQRVMVFQNNAIRTRSKRLLYVLMTPGGEFISANHKLV